jgi:hypothetical protein
MPDTGTAGSPRVGFIGTGLIGTPMVQRLLEFGQCRFILSASVKRLMICSLLWLASSLMHY